MSIWLVLIPLALSAYTHLWNPAGFPNLFYDEGVYMRRAMHVMEGLGPQEAYYYDHPFFGQIFLGGILKIIGFPQSLNPSADPHSIESLYQIPRALMGILAVVDTFLIYKISERMYNRNVALFGSIIFCCNASDMVHENDIAGFYSLAIPSPFNIARGLYCKIKIRKKQQA